MKLKTSFFNCGLLKSNLKRFWPLYLAYFVVLLLSIPMSAVSHPGVPGNVIVDSLRNYLDDFSLIVTFITAISAAMCVYGFMYTQKTCGMVASLPLKRKTIFASSACSGIIPILIINLIVGLITAIPLINHPDSYALESLCIWFAVTSMHYIAFFGIASIIAVITGSTVALPVFYIILNFLALGIESAIREIFSDFIYGYSNAMSKLSFEFLSPFSNMMGCKSLSCSYAVGSEVPVITGVYNPEWRTVVIYAAVGLAFLVASMFIFRKRKMENCGDIIAVPFLRPIFKYCVALCTAMANGILLRGIFGSFGILAIDAATYLVYIVLGAFIGYFGSEMLLRKRFTVFKGNWLGFALLLAFCAAFMWCCVTDYIGIGSSTPELGEIGYVEISTACGPDLLYLEDESSVTNVLDMNKSIIENKDTHINAGLEDSLYVSIDYHLNSGRIVSREYQLSLNSHDYELYKDILSSDEAKQYFTTPDVAVTADNISYCSFGYFNASTGESTYIDLTSQQAADFFTNGYTADVIAGNLNYYSIPDDNHAFVEIDFAVDENSVAGDTAHLYFHCYINPDCKYSLAWVLDNLGIDLIELF
ncbi:MAG: hypothetical protein Q4A83_08955 [Bacillota bacterium]|nr:hypothetical protein [Bacillota bacterium]